MDNDASRTEEAECTIPFSFNLQNFAEEEGGEGGESGDKGGEGPPVWTEQLPAEFKEDEEAKSFATIGDLFKTYKELKAGSEGVVKIPGEGATPEEVTEFYKTLGKPEKADGYELKVPKALEGLDINWFRNLAFENHLPKSTAEKLFNSYTQMAVNLLEEQANTADEELKESKRVLREEIWNKEGEYDTNVEHARRALKTFGKDVKEELLNTLDSQIQNSPALAVFLANIGKAMSEHKIIIGEKEGAKEIEATGQLTYDKSPELHK
jgi:hypothetical protein